MRILLLIFGLVSVTLHALAPNNAEKYIVIICAGTDNATLGDCNKVSQLENKGWKVVRIDIGGIDSDKVSKKVEDELRKHPIPSMAPVFVAGHGCSGGASHLISTKSGQQKAGLVKGSDLLSTVRMKLKTNPIWIASCKSGCSLYRNDICTGTSCGDKENSYAPLSTNPLRPKVNVERTLSMLVDLLEDEGKFGEVDTDSNLILSQEEIKAYFYKAAETTKAEGSENNQIDAPCFDYGEGVTQTPQLNQFRLYSPSYQPSQKSGSPHGKFPIKIDRPAHK